MGHEKVDGRKSESSTRRSGHSLMRLIGQESKTSEHNPYESDFFHRIPTEPSEDEATRPYPDSDFMLNNDIRTYERFMDSFKEKIWTYRIAGGLLLAGAVVDGLATGFAMSETISSGKYVDDPTILAQSIGITAFLGLSAGSAWKFYEAHMTNEDSQGTRDVLTKLRNGQDAGIFHGGGVD